MAWDDAMRVISAETQQLIDEVDDLDYGFIGPYEKTGDNEWYIEKLLLDHGLYIDGDADCVRLNEDICDDDASIQGEDDDGDEAEEVIAFCDSPECRCLSTFASDQNREDEPGPDDPNLICSMCGCAIDPSALEESSIELEEATVTETPLVVRRWPERGAGACYPIDGWVDGKTEAVITWRGTNGEGPWTRVYCTERDTLNAVGDIEMYENVALVSAVIRPREGTS